MKKDEVYTIDDIYALPDGVYRFEKETMEQYSFGEDVPAGIYEDFFMTVQ